MTFLIGRFFTKEYFSRLEPSSSLKQATFEKQDHRYVCVFSIIITKIATIF